MAARAILMQNPLSYVEVGVWRCSRRIVQIFDQGEPLVSLISPIACLLGRHDPSRRKVEWNGRQFFGECRHCGQPIKRVAHRTWRRRLPQKS